MIICLDVFGKTWPDVVNIEHKFWKDKKMKIQITKGKNKGIRGRVVGVYTDGRYDINVIKPRPGQPKRMVIKMTVCKEVR